MPSVSHWPKNLRLRCCYGGKDLRHYFIDKKTWGKVGWSDLPMVKQKTGKLKFEPRQSGSPSCTLSQDTVMAILQPPPWRLIHPSQENSCLRALVFPIFSAYNAFTLFHCGLLPHLSQNVSNINSSERPFPTPIIAPNIPTLFPTLLWFYLFQVAFNTWNYIMHNFYVFCHSHQSKNSGLFNAIFWVLGDIIWHSRSSMTICYWSELSFLRTHIGLSRDFTCS